MPRLLLIEDDARIRAAVEKSASLVPSYALESVCLADKAIPAVLKTKPDLILLDIRLPDGDGRVLLKKIKQNPATALIPVILLTGRLTDEEEAGTFDKGFFDYIIKPVKDTALLTRVKRAFQHYDSQSRL